MQKVIDFENAIKLWVNSEKSWFNKGTLVSRGRDALELICRQLKKNEDDPVILIPAYICSIVPEVIEQCGVKVSYYEVTPDLSIEPDIIKRGLSKKTSAIFYVNYFGFLQGKEKVKELLSFGLPLIEDNTQSFLSGSFSDLIEDFHGWSFNSFRKLLPIPDGGSVIAKKVTVGTIETMPPILFVLARLLGLINKSMALKTPHKITNGITQECFTYCVRHICFNGPAGMSSVSRIMLKHINAKEIFLRRNENYDYLFKLLSQLKNVKVIMKKKETNICPFGMAVEFEKRDLVQKKLLSQNINAPVLWQHVPPSRYGEFPRSHTLTKRMLILPVGESYTKGDMEKIASIIVEGKL